MMMAPHGVCLETLTARDSARRTDGHAPARRRPSILKRRRKREATGQSSTIY